MIAEKLRKAVLQAAMEGKLTEQLESDGNAIDLINQIKKDRERLLSEKIIKYSKLKNKNVIDINIPKNWVITNINEIAFVTKLAGFEYTKYIANNLVESGVPLFKGKNIQNGKLNLEFESYIPKLISQLLSRSRLDRKCLLTPYVGTIGNIAIFEADFEAHLGSNVGKIELFNHFRKNILEEYLLFFLRSEYGDAQLKRNKKATAQESISIQDIREVSVPIPPIEEQKRIVEKLEVLLAEIDKLEQDEKALKELEDNFPEKLKNSILKHAFEGTLIHIENYELSISDLEGKAQKKLDKNSDKYNLSFDIPNHWIVMPLVNKENFIKTGVQRYQGTKDYYSTGSVQAEGNVPIGKYTFDGRPSRANRLVKTGDIIEAKMANTVKATIIDETMDSQLMSTGFFQLRIKNEITRKYVYFYLQSPQFIKDKNDLSTGTTQIAINDTNLRKIMIPLPPLKEQEMIVNKIEELLPVVIKLEEIIS